MHNSTEESQKTNQEKHTCEHTILKVLSEEEISEEFQIDDKASARALSLSADELHAFESRPLDCCSANGTSLLGTYLSGFASRNIEEPNNHVENSIQVQVEDSSHDMNITREEGCDFLPFDPSMLLKNEWAKSPIAQVTINRLIKDWSSLKSDYNSNQLEMAFWGAKHVQDLHNLCKVMEDESWSTNQKRD